MERSVENKSAKILIQRTFSLQQLSTRGVQFIVTSSVPLKPPKFGAKMKSKQTGKKSNSVFILSVKTRCHFKRF